MKILFICTHNRCRSILAEAITNQFGVGKLIAKSAGSQPAHEVHPLSLKYLTEAHINTNDLCSQSWDVHEQWNPNIVITVCDSAAGESCPLWLGKALRVHWGLADPSQIEGSDMQIADAFTSTIYTIKQRILALLNENCNGLSQDELKILFTRIGEI